MSIETDKQVETDKQAWCAPRVDIITVDTAENGSFISSDASGPAS